MQNITVIAGSCSDRLIRGHASSMASLFVLQWKKIENKQLKQTYLNERLFRCHTSEHSAMQF